MMVIAILCCLAPNHHLVIKDTLLVHMEVPLKAAVQVSVMCFLCFTSRLQPSFILIKCSKEKRTMTVISFFHLFKNSKLYCW